MLDVDANMGTRAQGCRLPESWEHTERWGPMRRCVNASCLAAFVVSDYCHCCDERTMEIGKEAKLEMWVPIRVP